MHFRPVDTQIEETLIEKCQQNGWLMRGGYDWQDDPYLEEYPYEFCVADDLEELRSFFTHGNWAIRQGICYKDLAFIQQVNGGDEWWTLKRVDDGWLDFENISFEGTVEDPDRFDHLICSMAAASPQVCHDLPFGQGNAGKGCGRSSENPARSPTRRQRQIGTGTNCPSR